MSNTVLLNLADGSALTDYGVILPVQEREMTKARSAWTPTNRETIEVYQNRKRRCVSTRMRHLA